MTLEPLLRFVSSHAAAIDRDHRREQLPSAKAAVVLLTATIAVIVPKLVGSPATFAEHPSLVAAFSFLPWPDMHAELFWAAFKLVHYGILPALCIKLVLRRDLRDHGLSRLRPTRAWWIFIAMIVVMLPITINAASHQSFLDMYPKYENAGASVAQLVTWELAYGFQFLLVEFFFRGFLLFALARYMGWLSIFVMVLPYAMLHLNKPFAECAGSVLTGIALGALALRTSSIYGGALVHCTVAWTMDIAVLAHKGQLHF